MLRKFICGVCLLMAVQLVHAQQLVRLEYFLDTDPGWGNGIPIPFTQDTSLNAFQFNANVSMLSPGLHALGIRSLDDGGKWSLTRMQAIFKFNPPLNNGIAPNLITLEYFFDTDPGFGNATQIPITADSVLNVSFPLNTSGLNAGLHLLHVRSKNANGLWSLTQSQYVYKFAPAYNNGVSANITYLEYFIDTDPGFGNANSIPLVADSILSALTFNPDVSSLNAGLHQLFVRSRDANNQWSITSLQYFYKYPSAVTNMLPTLSRLEYFFDADPGFGNATNIPISNDTLLNAFTFNAVTSSLSAGLHTLVIRAKDANQRWGLSAMQYVYKYPTAYNNGVAPFIHKIEYFVDVDPGFGNGIDVPVTADSTLNGITFSPNVTALPAGLHVLFVRSKDVHGKWSLTQQQYFYKYPPALNTPVPLLSRIEYFIDVDPGFHNGVQVPFTSDTVLTAFNLNTDVSGVGSGLHILSLRAKDANQNWSLTHSQWFYKFPTAFNNGIAPSITKLEYFIDTDPGFGSAQDIPIPSDSIVNSVPVSLNTSALSSGLHTLFVRSKDGAGKWSLSSMQYVYKFPAPVNNNMAPAIVQMEYFIDTDPGFGNAQAVAFTPDSTVLLLNINTSVASLTPGLHELFLRSKDATGKWSLTQLQYIYKFPTPYNNNIAPSITKAEYFVDTDPGFGNAVNISFVSDSVVNNVSFQVNPSSLPLGIHHVFVRTKDASGQWSLSKAGRFTKDKLKFFIQGYYAGANQMYPVLMNQGIGSALNIVDTVTVELHQATAPYTLKTTAKGLLQTNGELICALGNTVGNYFIVIKHRNGLETWSSTAVALGSNTLSYDFSTAANKAYGNNQKLMQSGVYALYSGDLDQDGGVDVYDFLLMAPEIIDGTSGFTVSDMNGDGSVDLYDFLILDQNITLGVTLFDPI